MSLSRESEFFLAALTKSELELKRLEKEVNTEEETFKRNTDYENDDSYKYHKAKVDKLDSVLENKKSIMARTSEQHKAKRLAQIEKYKNEMKRLDNEIDRLTNEIDSYETRTDDVCSYVDTATAKQIEYHQEKMKSIREKMVTPTSLSYRRKKTRVEELENLIIEQRTAYSVKLDEENEKDKQRAIARHKQELFEAEQKERQEREIIYQKKLQDRIALEAKKEARWAAQAAAEAAAREEGNTKPAKKLPAYFYDESPP